MRKLLIYAVFSIGLLAAGGARGSELVYQPVNPSFGGYPGNGEYLLNHAQAQNDTHPKLQPTDPLTTFKNNLDSRILSYLSSKLVQDAFGDTTLQPGHYVVGDYSVDIDGSNPNLLSVLVTDIGTGNSTTIQIPRVAP